MIAPIQAPARFSPGQLVRHCRYGYRGVVVDMDPECRATDEWYEANLTQPTRQQTWYHVLVDSRGGATTYAAESSLESDTSTRPVDHPLIVAFFKEFTGTGYVRNDRPWPTSG